MILKKFKKIPSTNIQAKTLALGGAAPWTVVVAEEQTMGYGRKGDEWYSPKGGLYFSVILPREDIDDLQTITILTAFVLAKVIKEKLELEPMIKLPNDVLLRGKKVCGILTENVLGKEVKASVLGIGINTNTKDFPPEIRFASTSLKTEWGKEIDNLSFLKEIIGELERQFKIISK